MNKPFFSIVSIVSIVVASALQILQSPSLAFAEDKPTHLRRFAYVIGANDGGQERVKLRYAGTDAKKVATLLRDLGGVKKVDVVEKTSANAADIAAGFAELRPKLLAARASGARVELIVYYSGHSDETGLLLAQGRLEYSKLRKTISSMPADVNIAILDSCASGAFTRTKGGKREAAFLVDESSKVTGYAFISSSSSDEVAQESDRISASFFTHYLISGMRGGADANRDGKVTLNEAYQFAFTETVARTESTIGGAQHPAYNMHLVGTGDVIMTDLRATSASLVVGKDVRGRLFVRDQAGNLVIEINKSGPHPVELGLSPGNYVVTLKHNGKLFSASIRLVANRRNELAQSAFDSRPLEAAVARGGAPGSQLSEDSDVVDDGYIDEPLRFSVVPQVRIGSKGLGPSPQKTRTGLSLNVLVGSGDALRGLEVGGLVNVMSDDVEGVQVAGLANVVGGSTRGVRAAGLINHAGGSTRGVNVGGLVNSSIGASSGIGFGGLVNYSHGGHRGIAVGGLVNASFGDSRGIAIGGLANYHDANFRGVQVAGLSNSTNGHVEGTQISGIANFAGSIRGAQVGLFNIAGRVKGIQLGLVNVAQEADAAVGLFNLVGNGYRAAELWTTDTAPLNLGVKLGARFTYGLLALGIGTDSFQFGGGFGFHRPLGNIDIDIDMTGATVLKTDFGLHDVGLLAKLRLAVGYEVAHKLSVFGGASMTNSFFFDDPVRPLDKVTPISSRVLRRDDFSVRISPGFFAGVRLGL